MYFNSSGLKKLNTTSASLITDETKLIIGN